MKGRPGPPTDVQLIGGPCQLFIAGPKTGIPGQEGGAKKMRVDKPETAPHQPVPLDKKQHFLLIGHRRRRQPAEQIKNFPAPGQVAAGQLANHERMRQHPAAQQ